MDLILLNGKIITVGPDDAIVEALAVRDGKIAAVGATQDNRTLAGARTRVVDLGGRCVTPGLVDSHIHVILYGQQFRAELLDLRFPKARSKNELLQLVGARARETPSGQWIVGNQGFNMEIGDAPSRLELDAVALNHPVYLLQQSGQFAVVNTRALQAAGIDRNTSDPLNAKIGREATSREPNGLLLHYPAQYLVHRHIPGYSVRNEADRMN
jgi:predicted amidohydrolase YtcJ